MSKQQEKATSLFDFEKFPVMTPAAMFEPCLKAQSALMSAVKAFTDHWFERRAADFATLERAAEGLNGGNDGASLLEAQQRYASAVVERVVADLSALQKDLVDLGTATGAALGKLNGGTPPKTVAE